MLPSSFPAPARNNAKRPAPGQAWLARCALSLGVLSLSACVTLPTLPTVVGEEEQARRAVAEEARQAARPSKLCSGEPGSPFALSKKVLLLSLPVDRPLEAADLPGLSSAWSRALQQRLVHTQRFLVRDGSAYHLDPADDARKQVLALARQFDAQFVIAGRFASLGAQKGRIELGSLPSLPQPFGDVRVVVTEMQVYDGYTGTLLRRLEHDSEVRGTVQNRERRTLQGDFFHTPLGRAMEELLDRQGEDLEDELACLPMQARIVRTHLQEVQIDAGFTSNLQVGDRLRIYQRQGGPTTMGGESGWTEQAYGDLVIRQVFPESALGHIEGEAPDWRLNGFVRAW